VFIKYAANLLGAVTHLPALTASSTCTMAEYHACAVLTSPALVQNPERALVLVKTLMPMK
jgi:hypothetical protein